MARIIGVLFYAVSPQRKKLLQSELRKSLNSIEPDDRQINNIIKQSCILYWQDLFEILNYPEFGNNYRGKALSLKVITEVKGLPFLDAALEKGGVILLHLHFGAMQMVLPALAHRGYAIAQVGESRLKILDTLHRGRSSLLRRILTKQQDFEESLPAPFFYIDDGTPVRKVFKWLKKGNIIDLAADGRQGSNWLKCRFLQRPAYFPDGPFRLARMTESTILPCFLIRRANNTLKLVMEAPLSRGGNVGHASVSDQQLQEFLDLAEAYVTMYPSHYCKRLWVMAREKSRLPYPLFMD